MDATQDPRLPRSVSTNSVAPNVNRRWWLLISFPYVFSFMIHLIAILALASVYLGTIGNRSLTLRVATAESVELFEVDSLAPEAQPPSVTDAEWMDATSEPSRQSTDPWEPALAELTDAGMTVESVVSTVHRIASAERGNANNPTAMGMGSGGYFGVESYGEKFVYVVDSSGSMGGKRWDRATKELLKTIANMGPTQRFLVICFDYDAHLALEMPLERIRYLQPDRVTRLKLSRWIQSLELGGDTRPANAMRIALAMKPDAIYLLSDGEIADDTISVLQSLNRDRVTGEPIVPVHTISLYSNEGQKVLEAIAAQNCGQFVKID